MCDEYLRSAGGAWFASFPSIFLSLWGKGRSNISLVSPFSHFLWPPMTERTLEFPLPTSIIFILKYSSHTPCAPQTFIARTAYIHEVFVAAPGIPQKFIATPQDPPYIPPIFIASPYIPQIFIAPTPQGGPAGPSPCMRHSKLMDQCQRILCSFKQATHSWGATHTRAHTHTHTCSIPYDTVQTMSEHLGHCYQSYLQVLQRKLQRKAERDTNT